MLRFILLLLLAIFVVWCSTSVPLGKHSLAGHVKRIWSSDETEDLKDGVKQKATSEGTKQALEDVKQKAGPVVDRVKRGVKAGLKEAVKRDAGAAR